MSELENNNFYENYALIEKETQEKEEIKGIFSVDNNSKKKPSQPSNVCENGGPTEEGTTQITQGIESEVSNDNVTITKKIIIPNGNTNEADNIPNKKVISQRIESKKYDKIFAIETPSPTSNDHELLKKKRGPKPKNPNKKYYHTQDNYDNYIIKVCRLFVNSYIQFLNDRYDDTFEEIGTKYSEELQEKKIKTLRFRKIQVIKIFGQGYKKHYNFLKMNMENVLGENKINKFIIGKMNDERNDVVFNAIMKKTVKELVTNYEKNRPKLNIGKARLYIRRLPTFNKAKKQLKKKNRNTNVGKRKRTFMKLIKEEKKRQRSSKKKKKYFKRILKVKK